MTIFQQAEQLKYSMELPFGSKESIMLLDGTPYQCGSDYSPEFLDKSLEEIDNDIIQEHFSWEDLHGHINNEGELEV